MRIRHCVECLTRYLLGFSPYPNGSYLVPLVEGLSEGWTLYCSCGSPPRPSRWNWTELKPYLVATQAYDRGYGLPEEIVAVEEDESLPGCFLRRTAAGGGQERAAAATRSGSRRAVKWRRNGAS